MARQPRIAAAPATTAQRLGSILKSARDKMRKDKGLNGDLDRLPMLTWLMFLRFLDEREEEAEQLAALSGGEPYRPVVGPPYRWRDWALSPPYGLTGDPLLHFIDGDEATFPDGTTGPGLLAYLRQLSGTPLRDAVAGVFDGLRNRMESGQLLREVIDAVDRLGFRSSEEIHTLGHLYESLLKEMRDAAGDSGEFYTPRAVVQFVVAATNPRLGEVVLDPAAGTGGFLVEAYRHLEAQVAGTADRRVLQTASIRGQEAKSLPFLLCQMNLILHGLEAPDIVKGNSLDVRLADISTAERVDVILTNPPFGGEEERGILRGFPDDRQTAETALLFLQLIMRKLRAAPNPGRAAVVVPNGTLFGDGVAARIKQDLLTKFNLHTVVRLPNGVFAPYTSIPTNILFFDRSGPTQDVWYYEHPLPEGRKQYTKTQPLQFGEFAPCLAWWADRAENERAWKVPAAQVAAANYNLDIKNPHARQDFEHLPPERLVADILAKESRIADIMREIQGLLAAKPVGG